MTRHSNLLMASAIALATLACATTDAEAFVHRRHTHYVAPRGDIVVRTGRSYLDPGTSAEVGTEDRYFSDTIGYSRSDLGTPFTSAIGGYELLPGRFFP